MTPTELIAHARRRGIELRSDGARLGYRALVGVVDAGLVASLTAHKTAILVILASGALPCPGCRQALDIFEACWECPGRLCQGCGAWMAQRAYARECAACLAARFAQLEHERRDQERSAPADNARLHACPGCSGHGRTKMDPALWSQCAVCDPEWRERKDPR